MITDYVIIRLLFKNFQKPFHLITIKWNSFNVITNNVIICFLFSILQRPLDLSTSQPPIKYLWVMLSEIVLLILITLSSFNYDNFKINNYEEKIKFFHFIESCFVSFSLFESEVRIINMLLDELPFDSEKFLYFIWKKNLCFYYSTSINIFTPKLLYFKLINYLKIGSLIWQ